MEILYFTLGAITLALGLIAKPYVDVVAMRLKRVFTRKNAPPIIGTDPLVLNNIEVIVNQVNDLQTQVDNLAEVVSRRDKNRKHNIRRDVRDYLSELRSDK